ncbi:MAG: CNNM domain-containing protein [Planctomycetota bacterium]
MPPTEIILAAILLPPMLLLSGLVSGSETAIFGIDHPSRARLANASPAAGQALAALQKYPRHLLAALLALNNVINITYFSVASVLGFGLERDGHTALAVALPIAALIGMILVGEITAKLFAASRTVAFCKAVAGLWLVIIRGGWPLWSSLDAFVIRPLVRLASSPRAPTTDQPTASDLAAILNAQPPDRPPSEDPHPHPHHTQHADHQPAQHPAHQSDQRLLAQIINLGDRRVRLAMRPRIEIPTLTLAADHDRVDATLRATSRALVLDDSDRPLGWLSAIAYFAANQPQDPGARRRLVEPARFIPETATLDNALSQLREAGVDRAVVVDELGNTEGVIRIEDIVATLIEIDADPNQPCAGVGAQPDAHDRLDEPRLVALGTFAIPGRWPAQALLEDLDLPHDQAERLLSRLSTVGGLTLALLGRVPDQGDTIDLPGATLTVTRITGRVVDEVEVTFHAAAEPETNDTQATDGDA